MHDNPFLFSVVIPSYNRPKQLSVCLYALMSQDYPSDRFEVIVIDDGSHIPMEKIVASFRDRINVKLIRQANTGPASARNTGAKYAKGKFLVFTDDDCIPNSKWLKTLANLFDKIPNCIIGGRTINALPHNIYASTSQLLIDYLYSYYNTDSNKARFITSNNLALSKKHFSLIGGFNPIFTLPAGEDRELCYRFFKTKSTLIYAPEVIVYHAHCLTFSSFWRQQFNYGRGAYLFRQLCYQRWHEIIDLEPLFFYFKLILNPILQHGRISSLMFSMLILVSQIATFVGYFKERVVSGKYFENKSNSI